MFLDSALRLCQNTVMKINAEVLAVSTNGDNLSIRAQGQVPHAADWRPMVTATIELPDNATTRKAFHVGRKIAMQIKTR